LTVGTAIYELPLWFGTFEPETVHRGGKSPPDSLGDR
jgi:hypothetical protein